MHRSVIAAAKRNGKILATAENIRRNPGPRTAHWLFHERGLLGQPTVLYSQSVEDRRPRDTNERPWIWQWDRQLSGGGPVMDSGAHFCDTIRYLYGEVESCYGRVLHLG